MNTNETIYTNDQDLHNHKHHMVCWKSIFTGLLGSLLVYFILSSLGAGIAGFRVAHLIARSEDGAGIMTGAGVWLGISAVVSLFLGAYFATRMADSLNRKVGGAHGVVIAALFFAWLLHGAGNSMGSLVQLSGSYMGNDSAMVSGASGNAVVISEADAEKAARTVADIGWVFFATFVLGSGAAILGGYEGVRANDKKPMHTYTLTRKKA